jgi:rsbT antagonist protein RsbS
MPSLTPILRQGSYLIASLQAVLTDDEWLVLRAELAERVTTARSRVVIIDVSSVDLIDSFATRMLRSMAQITRLRGADTVVVGIAPDVAFAMVQLGLTLDGISTALDLDEAMEMVQARSALPRDAV